MVSHGRVSRVRMATDACVLDIVTEVAPNTRRTVKLDITTWLAANGVTSWILDTVGIFLKQEKECLLNTMKDAGQSLSPTRIQRYQPSRKGSENKEY